MFGRGQVPGTLAGDVNARGPTETEAGGTKSKTWSSKKYPGLVVKMEAGGMTMELVEFNE